VPSKPTISTPGRSLVTRRAIVDIVRAARHVPAFSAGTVFAASLIAHSIGEEPTWRNRKPTISA